MIHYVKLGLGFKFSITPYSAKLSAQFGTDVYYQPIYDSHFEKWYHGVGFNFFISNKYNFHVYRKKPHKFITKKHFQNK